MKQEYTKELVFGALGIALVFISTMFLMLFSGLLGPFASFMVGGVGSAFADIAGGYGSYAIATMLIKGAEGALVALLVHRSHRLRLPAYLLGSLLMIAGYYVTDSLLNASWIVGLAGIPGNLIQAAIGILIAMAGAPFLQRLKERPRE